MDYPKYTIQKWLEDDQWVATTSEFPSLSWMSDSPDEAIKGLLVMIEEVREDLLNDAH